MILFFKIFFTEFIAEMGDKTQLMLIALTSKYKLRDIICGTAIAILVLNGLAVLAGGLVSELIPEWLIKMIAAFAFLYFAASTIAGDEEEEEEPRSTFSFFKKKEPEVEEESSNSKISQPFDNTITASREAKKRRFTSTGSKVVSMNGRGVEVYVIKPQDFAEAQTAADLLKEGRTVVINLEGIELTVAQRSIDFVGGATYAINGSLQAVSNNIFIAAPDSIEVSGDLKSEIMNENTISPQLK